MPGMGSAVALAYAAMVATFPDEQMYLATNWLHEESTHRDLLSGVVLSTDRPNRYAWIAPVNTLDLHGEDLIEDAKLAHILEKNEAKNVSSTGAQRWVATLLLAVRDLTGANLIQADVRHVDFSGAILNRADLNYAWAERARFDNAQLQGASLVGAHLQSASLVGAHLQSASLVGARLQGASLGVSFRGARPGQLQVLSTQLQGASLYNANLQGASFDHAQLQGVSLDHAQLQGASFNGTQLEGASLVDVCAWRADARQAAWQDARAPDAQLNPYPAAVK